MRTKFRVAERQEKESRISSPGDEWPQGGSAQSKVDNDGLWWRRLCKINTVLLMSKTFRPSTIDQPLLLPPSVQDFVDEAIWLASFWALVLEPLDLGEMEAASAGERGQPAV